MIFKVSTYYRDASYSKYLGCRVVPGYRAEVIDGLPDGTHVYSGACKTEREAVYECIAQLKEFGYSGVVKIVR